MKTDYKRLISDFPYVVRLQSTDFLVNVNAETKEFPAVLDSLGERARSVRFFVDKLVAVEDDCLLLESGHKVSLEERRPTFFPTSNEAIEVCKWCNDWLKILRT